ncbi:MAG: hypothetical protein QOJ99_5096, partial [Bryobacterales bacterium]|nr:hypothetical protein [Bryobacterales bacterium]
PGIVGALLFYLAPVVGKGGTVAYIDVATAAAVFGAFCFLEISRAEQAERALIPAVILGWVRSRVRQAKTLIRRLGATALF